MSDEGSANWELCNRTWRRIVEHHGPDATAADFPSKERNVALVWTVHGIVGNGGFESLFGGELPGDPDYRLSLRAFEAIGCYEAASAFADALAVFPRGEVPKSAAKREKLFTAHPERARDLLAGRFCGAARAIERCLAAYIRENHLALRGH